MKNTRRKIVSIFVLFLFSGSIIFSIANIFLRPKENVVNTETVIMETSKGIIEIELYRTNAPITVENFLKYVNKRFYDGLCFHRIIPGFMIQGGGFYVNGTFKQPEKPIQIESNNGLQNVKGAIAMARSSDPNSATSQFYINTVDNPSLDYPGFDGYGYTVFGKVTSGFDVLESIEASETDTRETLYGPMNDWPIEPVEIIKTYIKEE
jgi:peptidyl-prolyl cis-trans isomerase A (cyclophilin A)